jgi:hypothetical protein
VMMNDSMSPPSNSAPPGWRLRRNSGNQLPRRVQAQH